MSAYEQGRDQEYLARLNGPINDFISRYNANPSGHHKTIFFFPGGMGSQLMRATTASQNGPPFFFYTAWIDCSIILGAATNLQMLGEKDFQQYYVVPDGCVDFINLRPYYGFIQWCQNNWIDLFIFGWDWRRESKAAADFFLEKFLPEFETRVAGCTPHPLDNFWLLGHSFGGIVVKQILNHSNSQYVRQVKRAITVATPFYGYGGQVHRFFKGDSQLNWTEGPDGAKKITEIVSTLPGGYELLFLDGASYDANQAAFANDPEGYNLTSYPSMDANTPSERADPYNPIPGAPTSSATGAVRYISNYRFNWHLLGAGKSALYEVARPLDAAVAAKFWNIRGVQFKRGTVLNGTVVGQKWARVSPNFDPDTDQDPIADKSGPGDGTLPAWSTRLLGNPNVITIKGDIEHMDLMNEASVQIEIAKLMEPTPKALKRMRRTATRKTAKMKTASRKNLNNLLDELRAITAKEGLSPRERNVAIRAHLAKFGADELQEFLARAYLDAFKSPSQISAAAGNHSYGQKKKERKRGMKRKRK
jgi:hypothetical protein